MQVKYLALLAVNISLINGLVIPSIDNILNFDNLLSKTESLIASEQLPVVDTFKEIQAPILSSTSTDKVIPGKYIVVFKENFGLNEINIHKKWIEKHYRSMNKELNINSGHNPLEFFRIGSLFNGYSGYFDDELIKIIQLMPIVKFIERDSIMTINEFDIQKDATWALSRISHRELTPSTDYLYDTDGGKGVVAYVIDTGIKVEHDEFEGRASWGDAIAFPKIKFDGHGHGTHCAGIIGSKTYGVAKDVELVAVGVMNALGTGSISDIIKGVEFVVEDHQKNAKSKKGFKGSVVNMSIGGGNTDALDLAVNAATSAGLHIAVAAGNDNEDACVSSPARATGPITVGASNNLDARASFSNWGSCVDIFAPGEDILSTFTWSKTTLMSGTSMASPHIAGLLSYYLSLYPESDSGYSSGKLLDPLSLKSKLIKYGTKGVLTNLDPQSPNVLSFNGAGANLTDFWNL